MSNLSYCRFRNTLEALRDCEENWLGNVSDEEDKARLELLHLCQHIAKSWR